MTAQNFLSLNPLKQQEAISEAVQIGKYRNKSYSYTCYQINGFYVEIRKHVKNDVIEYFRVFEHTDHLDPYLKQQGPLDMLLKGILPVVGCFFAMKVIKLLCKEMDQISFLANAESFCM